nr:D-glycerate dehydrogenase [Burkholderia vietnamiensis]
MRGGKWIRIGGYNVKQKILVTRKIFGDIIARLEEVFEVEHNVNDNQLSSAELQSRLADKVGAILMGGDQINEEIISSCPSLRAVCNCAAGYNNMDLPSLTRAGIIAMNTPELSNESVADHAWGLMIAAARRTMVCDEHVRSGAWRGFSFELFLGADMHRTTLGIVGMGRIGQAIARRAAGFDMDVLYSNRNRLTEDIEARLRARHVTLDQLLTDADHVVLALPYSPNVHHLISAPQLARMKPTATLVNVARGGIVNDEALAAALHANTIAGAGLDVFEGEPSVHPALLIAPNLVMTPHVGSATLTTRRAIAHLAVDNLVAALDYGPNAGQPKCILNPEVLTTKRSVASSRVL